MRGVDEDEVEHLIGREISQERMGEAAVRGGVGFETPAAEIAAPFVVEPGGLAHEAFVPAEGVEARDAAARTHAGVGHGGGGAAVVDADLEDARIMRQRERLLVEETLLAEPRCNRRQFPPRRRRPCSRVSSALIWSSDS